VQMANPVSRPYRRLGAARHRAMRPLVADTHCIMGPAPTPLVWRRDLTFFDHVKVADADNRQVDQRLSALLLYQCCPAAMVAL
jgi:hypothetical protein